MLTSPNNSKAHSVEVLPLSLVQEWDDYVSSHPDRSPYHSFGWLTSIKQAYGFDVLPLVVRDSDQSIIGILPLVEYGWPFNKFCALPYCDLGGPLVNSDDVKTMMLEWIQTHAKQHAIRSLELRQNVEVIDPLQSNKVRMLLALPASPDELLASFKSKLRSQINKSMRNGLVAKIGNNPAQVANFYNVYARNMRDLGSPPHDKQWFDCLSANYGQNVIIATIWHNEICIGAGFVIRSGQKWSIPWASTIQEFNSLAPNMLLYWELLSYCCSHGGGVFDFGRSTPGEGTYKFKAQWGALPEALDWQTLSDSNQWQLVDPLPLEKQSKPSAIRDVLTKIWRRLPVGLSTFLGCRLRKFITL